MGTETKNYKFQKPGEDDFYDITVQNQNWDLVDEELYEIKKSVSDGKSLIAAAITAKNVATDALASFATMAANIGKIVLGGGTAEAGDILAGKTKINADGTTTTGTLADNSRTARAATPSLDAANSRLQMTIPATAKYDTASKLTAAYSTIRSLIGLTADKLWYNTTILGLKSSRTGQAAKTWTPGTANQTIAAGTCVTGTQTIKGDANLIEANIKKDVTIFGKTGTWEGYVKNDTTFIYNGGTNYDGFSIPSENIRDGYLSFSGLETIGTVKQYDTDRSTGVLVECHANLSTPSIVSVYALNPASNTYVLVGEQTILATELAPHYFNFAHFTGMRKLRFSFRNVNVSRIQLYV